MGAEKDFLWGGREQAEQGASWPTEAASESSLLVSELVKEQGDICSSHQLARQACCFFYKADRCHLVAELRNQALSSAGISRLQWSPWGGGALKDNFKKALLWLLEEKKGLSTIAISPVSSNELTCQQVWECVVSSGAALSPLPRNHWMQCTNEYELPVVLEEQGPMFACKDLVQVSKQIPYSSVWAPSRYPAALCGS